MKNKQNPRKRPASFADIKRAKKKATDDAINAMVAMFLYSLKDLGATDEQLDEVMEKFKYTAAGINSGDTNVQDIKSVLNDEYDIQLEL